MKRLLRLFSLAMILIGAGAGAAHAQVTLGTIEVTASTSDGGSISVPFFAKGSVLMSPYLRLGNDGASVDMTKDQYCVMLAGSLKPSNCSLTTYPPAPGIVSASGASWSGNGCGASP